MRYVIIIYPTVVYSGSEVKVISDFARQLLITRRFTNAEPAPKTNNFTFKTIVPEAVTAIYMYHRSQIRTQFREVFLDQFLVNAAILLVLRLYPGDPYLVHIPVRLDFSSASFSPSYSLSSLAFPRLPK